MSDTSAAFLQHLGPKSSETQGSSGGATLSKACLKQTNFNDDVLSCYFISYLHQTDHENAHLSIENQTKTLLGKNLFLM